MPNPVPKVHPVAREVLPDDPMELHATTVSGDPELMLRCAVEEYAQLGWDIDQIYGLFSNSFYPALNRLLKLYGERGTKQRIAEVLGRTGVFSVAVTVVENQETDEPMLVELTIPAHLKSAGQPDDCRPTESDADSRSPKES